MNTFKPGTQVVVVLSGLRGVVVKTSRRGLVLVRYESNQKTGWNTPWALGVL